MEFTFEEKVIKTPDLEFDEECGGIGNVYFKAFKKYSERIAVINTKNDEFDTYKDLLRKSVATASEMQRRCLKKQDLVAICSNRENLNAHLPLIASQFLGCISFSIDPVLTLDECIELLKQAPPKIIFVIEKSKQLITKAFDLLNINAEIVVFGKEFEEFFLNMEEVDNCFEPVYIENLDDTAIIHFSSGSTGTPKPICLSHYNLLAFCACLDTEKTVLQNNRFANLPLGIVALTYSTWYWCSASFEMVKYTTLGGCRLLRDIFVPEEIWMLIEKYHVNELMPTPLNCIELSRIEKPSNIDISSLSEINIGGYVLHTQYICNLRKMFPDAFVVQLYGMTECGETILFNMTYAEHRQLAFKKPDSCGLPVQGLSYKVINLSTGMKCGPNEPGELHLKGKHVFNRFYNKSASGLFDDEGYFRTGDLVCFDDNFCFYILDRIKGVLGWNDWLIYPYYIEKVLNGHPAVFNAIVIGIPHEIEGERLMGVVVLNEGFNVKESDLVEYVEQRVEDHKRLREGVTLIKSLPTTATGKISRLKVKKYIMDLLKESKD